MITEQQINVYLRSIPELLSFQPWQLQAITIGQENTIWKIIPEKRRSQTKKEYPALICRISSQQHSHSLALQQHLATQQLSAKILHQAIHYDRLICIMPYLIGEQNLANTWHNEQLSCFAKQLVSLHLTTIDLPLPIQNLDVVAQLHQYLNTIKTQGLTSASSTSQSTIVQQLPAFYAQIKQLQQQLQQYPTVPSVLCHGDLNPFNIIYQPHTAQFTLLDWDYAGYNDVYFDLAGFITEHQLSADQQAFWLAEYCQHYYHAAHHTPLNLNNSKIAIYQQIYRLLCRLWKLNQSLTG